MLLPSYGLDWMFVYVMRGFLRACKRSLLLSAFLLRAKPIHQTVMRTHVVICVPSPPLLHHLTIASALVAKMRTKSTARIVSHFCVRRCLLFTVTTHVQPPLLKIREEKSVRRWSSHRSSHRTFVEYLSPIPLLHHTLCSNDTKIQNMNIGCTVGHCGHIIRRTSCKIYKLSPFHCTRTHVVSRRVGQVGADGTETFATSCS